MATRKPTTASAAVSIDERVEEALAWLKKHASPATREGMARYAIPADNALGVAVKDIKALGSKLGRDQALAQALWKTGIYEARMLVQFVGDPTSITAREMDAWCRAFDNWAYCDALAFNLFDRTPHAWAMVDKWCARKAEFERRAGFALLWALALHDRESPDADFLRGLEWVRKHADDERNFVKKAVSMALKAVGQKRSPVLKVAAKKLARELAASPDPTRRWIGKDALTKLGQ